MANKVYEIVTERIIEALTKCIEENKPAPWHKPWRGVNGLPRNYCSMKAYQGVNLLLLDESEQYLTWNQLMDLKKVQPNLQLRKGSKANLVVYFSFKDGVKEVVKDGLIEEKKIQIPYLKYYHVYAVSDIEGLERKELPQAVTFEHSPIEEAERICKAYVEREGIKVNIKPSNRAYFSPLLDELVLPELKQFENPAEYYSCYMHEIIHSTGTEQRLNRLTKASFGSDPYSREELTAEIGSCMLASYCGIDNAEATDNSVAYLRSWLKALKDDVTLIVSASAKAQKACDFVLGVSENE